MNEKKRLNDEELKNVNGSQTWEEIREASKSWLPEGTVTCKNPFCGKTFNARENAHGFMNYTDPGTGMTATYAIALCPYCGGFWSRS